MADADAVVAALLARGETVATAESLTGGMLCARLVDVEGASAVVRGGVVAYDPTLKEALLGVDPALIAERGTVDADVARHMAQGVRTRLGATWGVSTTGEAGPHSIEDKPVGTVFIGVCGPSGTLTRELALSGSRSQIRQASVEEALSVLLDTLEEQSELAKG